MSDFAVAVNTGPVTAMQYAAQAAAARSLRLSGVVYANALRTLTPPHGVGATMQNTQKAKNTGILKLRERIAEDIMGGAEPTFARPVRRADGSWMALDAKGHYTEGSGHFGFVVPTASKFGDSVVPIEQPAHRLRLSRWYRRKGSMRRYRATHDGPHFVTAASLKALVKHKQKNAGFTISGWYHGWRFFSTAKNAPTGFFPSLRGPGSAGADADLDELVTTFEDKGGWGYADVAPRSETLRAFAYVDTMDAYIASQTWPDVLKNKSRITERAVFTVAQHALRAMRQNILAWYKKKAKAILAQSPS